MERIFGLDIGTTSVGFAVIEHDRELRQGKILRLGVRIFPEARDPKALVPLNQERRQARLRRRQLRRRRERRRVLGELLCRAGLLPARGSPDWDEAMKLDPYELRRRAFAGETLSPREIGRAVYHLAQRRHFKAREIDEIAADADSAATDPDEKKATAAREETVRELERTGKPLGAWLAERGPHQRKRGVHATRDLVAKEFDGVWAPRLPNASRENIRKAIFDQRPVFWRLKTLGRCRFVPDADLCPRGSWLSQQRRMLEKLNNLALAGAEQRGLDEEERAAILAKLQTQGSMTWGVVRRELKPLYRARGKPGAEKALKFNLEEGGEKKLLGNALEAKLAAIFGGAWRDHPRKQAIRDSVPDALWHADYEAIADQRVNILAPEKQKKRRKQAASFLVKELSLSGAEAAELAALQLPPGWEPYSTEALRAMLPQLEAGVRFGELVTGPDWEAWRAETFPDRERPTGASRDKLPSPANSEERDHIARLRNPTVARTRNELRKVVNNLIELFGKPSLVRIELARDVGNSKRRREDRAKDKARQAKRREAARKDLLQNGIDRLSHANIEKWLLWKECGHRCPYTGDAISFKALFRTGDFEVEHIWPRSRSLDNSFPNKTLCRRDVNVAKGNRTPFEYFSDRDPEAWKAIVKRLYAMKAPRGGSGMSQGKIGRFLATSMPDDFAARQLNDTGYAARQAIAYLQQLWPDVGPSAPVRVQAVAGRVTAQLRRLWGLNNILADDGEKTRADHRHHAIDALTVACCHPGMTKQLSNYWQDKDERRTREPRLPPPWDTIRSNATKAVAAIIVSHRVRKKISGPLHKETVYGDTGEEVTGEGKTTYRYFVTRKNVEALTKSELKEIRDDRVREIVTQWIGRHGGDAKKAFPPYPQHGRKGPEIRRVRVRVKQQLQLMARVSTGYADLGRNHHMAVYWWASGKVGYEVVSLFEASRRAARGETVVCRDRGDGSRFLISLSLGDSLEFTSNGQKEIRVVKSLEAKGQVALVDHADAIGASRYSPRVNTIGSKIASKEWKKISVDPIGRFRPAND